MQNWKSYQVPVSLSPVLLQELCEPLVSPHPEDVSPVEVDVEGASKAAEDADEAKDEELLRVVREAHLEAGREHGHDRLLVLEPDGKEPEEEDSNYFKDCFSLF